VWVGPLPQLVEAPDGGALLRLELAGQHGEAPLTRPGIGAPHEARWQCHALHVGEGERAMQPALVLDVVSRDSGAVPPSPDKSLGRLEFPLEQVARAPQSRLRLLAPLGVVIELRWLPVQLYTCRGLRS
jgi:hypothetical protein